MKRTILIILWTISAIIWFINMIKTIIAIKKEQDSSDQCIKMLLWACIVMFFGTFITKIPY